ncbi:MAG: hypothetical protein F4Y04_03880 [Chloroflexi bacterium]|nr:hypothetical protein [Chloroflexota bacterium]
MTTTTATISDETVMLAHCAAVHYAGYSLQSGLSLAADRLDMPQSIAVWAVGEILTIPGADTMSTPDLLRTAATASPTI